MVKDSKLRQFDQRIDEFRQRIKDSDQRKVDLSVFDDATLKALYVLSSKGYITAMGGPIRTGKEAVVFHALMGEKELAVKIYRITTSDFGAMQEYINGDPRFTGIKQSKKGIVLAWTRKEFRNLKKAADAGVRVPEPIIFERNILVMEFIGKNGLPMPQLKEIRLDELQAKNIFSKIVKYMKILYNNGNLVHADLSEYNILLDTETMQPVIIDMGQSVDLDHPNSEMFLKRDATNILKYFQKYGIDSSVEKIISIIKKEEL